MKQKTFKVPNALILDTKLSLTARKVGIVLYARSNAFGYCHKSFAQLAEQSGCAASSVRIAVRELTDAGWVKTEKTYVWNAALGRRVYGKTAYQIKPMPAKGWTLLPRDFLRRNINLNASAFVVAAYLYVAAGSSRRAFPSIAQMAEAIGLSARTICRTLKHIRQMGELFVMHCISRKGDFAANSYHICTVVSHTPYTNKELKTRVLGTPLYAYIIRLMSKKSKVFLHSEVMTKSANIVKTQLTRDIILYGKNKEIPKGVVYPFMKDSPFGIAQEDYRLQT